MLHAEKETQTTYKCISLGSVSLFPIFASAETERGNTRLPLSSILPLASQKWHKKEAWNESQWKSQRDTAALSHCIQMESVFAVKKSQTHLSGLHISQCKPQRKKSYRMCCNVAAQSILHNRFKSMKNICVLPFIHLLK